MKRIISGLLTVVIAVEFLVLSDKVMGKSTLWSVITASAITYEDYGLEALNAGTTKEAECSNNRSHAYKVRVVAPTYDNQGYTLYTCTECGDSYKGSWTPKKTVPTLKAKSKYTSTKDAVRINWNKVVGATGYKVFRYDAATKKWVALKAIYDSDIITYKDCGLKAATVYKYRVKAFVKSDGKFYFGKSCDTIKTETKPAPVKIKSNYTCTTDAIRINWEKIKGVTTYIVYRWNGSDWKVIGMTDADTTTWRDSDKINSGSKYYYKVGSYQVVGGYVKYGGKSASKAFVSRPVKVNITSAVRSSDAIRINWKKVKCDGYQVFLSDGGKFKLIATIKNQNTLTYRATGLTPNKTYTFRIKAYSFDGNVKRYGGSDSTSVAFEDDLYNIVSYIPYYSVSKTKLGYISGLYTGFETSSFPGYVVINTKSGNVLVNKSCTVKKNNAKVLQTVSIGQYGGGIAGYAACGPTAVTMLVNSEKKEKWNKDSLILYSENHYLNDQGSLRNYGGMTAPRILELIKGYSGGKYTAKNIFGSDPTRILRNQINSGHRAVVVVRYSTNIDTYSYGTHFVVICGYEYINGNCYFYYADPFFGNGNRSLRLVDAETLSASMSSVTFKEPSCIIIMK